MFTVVKRNLLAGGLLLLAACAGSANVASPAESPGAAAFDVFWEEFDRTYPYFEFKQIDWAAQRSELRARAAAAADDQALVLVLRDAVLPLRDVHAWFRRPDGSGLMSYQPTRARNFDATVWRDYLTRMEWHPGQAWGWARVGDVGYLAVESWNPNLVRIEQVDAALEELRGTRALVLDVRMNGGGNDALALQLAGRFAVGQVRFEAVRYRNGPEHSDFGPWVHRELAPRGSWQYTSPVYVLTGRGAFSSNETFIAAMGELPNATLVGDTTGGSSGNPKELPLVVGGRDTGWKYSVPRWMAVLADGTVLEWNGIAPDVVVPYRPEDVQAGRDPVLDWVFARTGATNATR